MVQTNPAQIFLTEAADLLTQIEEIALEVDPRATDPETINRLFRTFHTIKGSGAMFGFDDVAAFTHHVETALDLVREHALAFSPELVELILASKDCIDAMLNGGMGERPAVVENALRIVAALHALHPDKQPLPAETRAPAAPDQGGDRASDSVPTPNEIWRIRFRPSPGIMLGGTNPLALLKELRGLGACTIRAELGAVPPLETIKPDHCYILWNVVLPTNRGLNAIKDVFTFVEDGSEISIEGVAANKRRSAELF
jgi:two-component system, chemotaxis family, sensor kinase CheA